jgi:hypothetical protein
MPVFPQLTTGASALYPVSRETVTRTAVTASGDGHRVVFADPDAGLTEWELWATGLTEDEREEIESLFEAVSGRLKTFTFLDPAGNLLAFSEEFGENAWTNGPLIQLTTGIDDPFGTARATRAVNAGQAAQAIAQTLATPGNFQYALSVWVRSAGAASVTLVASSGAGASSQSAALTGQWRRVSLAVALEQIEETVRFGVELAPGDSVDLFGMQVDAQPAASDYRKTGALAGLFTKARFASDELTVRARGTDVHDAVIRIVSAEK